MATAPDQDFFPEVRNPENIRVLNNRCLIRTQDGYCVVMVSGIVLAHYATTDRMAQAHAMVSLVEQGWADQIEVAGAFSQSVRTVRRQQRRFEDGGLAALGGTNGYPPGRARLPAARQEWVHKLKAQGHSNCEIARRLGVSETAVRKLLRRLGWKDSSTQAQLDLDPTQSSNPNLSALAVSPASQVPAKGAEDSNPNLSAFSSPTTPVRSRDTNPADRRGDRLLAYLGLLEDAAPLFGSGTAIPRAGVLLALPALIAGGVFECAHQTTAALVPPSTACAPVC